jgi:hypothetical protein
LLSNLGEPLKRSVGSLSLEMRRVIMISKPKLVPALICILTFCLVTVVVVDANIPFGYILVQLLRESDRPFVIETLLLVPLVGLLVSSFMSHPRTRGILTSLGALGLVVVWLLGLVRFVVYPIYPTPYPNAAKIVPAITSIPFVVAVIGSMYHSIRGAVAGKAPAKSLDAS